jgi:thiol:disulfide interchange protein DsbD
MHLSRFIAVVLAAVFFVLEVPAQSSLGVSASSAQHVSVETKLSVDRVLPGSTFQAAVVMTIAEGWHINSNTPTYDYLIATSLDLKPVEGFIVTDLQYPKGKQYKFEFADDPLDVYEGTAPIFISLKLSDKVAPGTYTLDGNLVVQACNDQVCLAPSTIPVRIDVAVAERGATVTAIHEELFAQYSPAETLLTGADDRLARAFESENALVAFFAIFLVGLALNLTPCVYPMMSVTVSLFGAQSDTNTLRVAFKATTYVLGIATMYSVLGVSAALSGGLFGSWLQSSWVLAGIAALLFGLALSMFGLYQIQVPYWLTSKLGGTTGTGLIGLYLSGLVVGVFAAPCIGPPVIALLAFVGAKGDPLFGFWVFFILSLGLGFPYLILGTFSGLLKKVPKSGVWLVWVERLFGVVLVGAALFYLSLAFLPKYSAHVVPITLLIGGVYLGFLEPSGKDRPAFRRFQYAFGVVALVISAMGFNALREPGLTWEPYSEQRLREARAAGKPVMIDFYADWCIPCLELERKTFTDPGVMAAADGFVRLKVDLTHFDSPEAERIRREFNIAGVPTIVFLDPNGDELKSARVVGYIPPKEFIARFQPLIDS